jgi:release factor glutamine methyltransferase
MLTEKDFELIEKLRAEQQRRTREIPLEGIVVNHVGKDFIVYNGVFIPFTDSEIFVESYKINPGESVLDIATGCGIIAVFSAYKGAGRVLATDVHSQAVNCARENARRHGFSDIIETRLSDMYWNIGSDERFDVITGNLPFRNKKAYDFVQGAQWDTDLRIQREFFAGLGDHLNPGGRAYTSQSNFGALDEMLYQANFHEFQPKLIGLRKMPEDPRMIYIFEVTGK